MGDLELGDPIRAAGIALEGGVQREGGTSDVDLTLTQTRESVVGGCCLHPDRDPALLLSEQRVSSFGDRCDLAGAGGENDVLSADRRLAWRGHRLALAHRRRPGRRERERPITATGGRDKSSRCGRDQDKNGSRHRNNPASGADKAGERTTFRPAARMRRVGELNRRDPGWNRERMRGAHRRRADRNGYARRRRGSTGPAAHNRRNHRWRSPRNRRDTQRWRDTQRRRLDDDCLQWGYGLARAPRGNERRAEGDITR